MGSNTTDQFFDQSITFKTPNGPTDVPIPDLDDFIGYSVQSGINYGAQIGASFMLLLALLLLTKPEKRRSAVFLINVLSLVLNVIRSVLHTVYFTGNFQELYAFVADDYSHVRPGDFATSVTTTVFEVLVLLSVESSLCLQVRAVCVTLRSAYRRLVLILSMLVGALAVTCRIVYTIKISILILNTLPEIDLLWLGKFNNITITVSICWFTLVFLTKLGFAIHQRRKLGMGGFGPMQVIFIMGCQTLIVPALLSIIQYTCRTPIIASNVLTAVAVFLPLSSLWASATLGSQFEDSRQAAARFRPNISYSKGSTLAESSVMRKGFGGSRSMSNATVASSGGQVSPNGAHSLQGHGLVNDLEAQDLQARGGHDVCQ